ncbi:hypothetical protein EYC84_002020 [Monilinia fructicola]|nr:hypothetical protein EYC84_002020 [Monilinia fructicola]
MEEILPRLWLSQTPNFLIAYHEFGLFNKPQISNVKDKVLEWQGRNSTLLSKFHVLVKRIMEIVKDSEDNRVEVSWDGEGPLRVTEQIKKENQHFSFVLMFKLSYADIIVGCLVLLRWSYMGTFSMAPGLYDDHTRLGFEYRYYLNLTTRTT